MAGTRLGGLKAKETNRKRYGKDFYSLIGKKGADSVNPKNRYWARNKEAARIAGRLGGLKGKKNE